MHNLIEYNNASSKTSGSLWQYYRDEPALDNNEIIIDFLLITIIVIYSDLNRKFLGQTENVDTKGVETMILLKYLSNFREHWKCF